MISQLEGQTLVLWGAIDLDQFCPKQHGFIYVVILPPAERGSTAARLL